jgi:hypothetical protein
MYPTVNTKIQSFINEEAISPNRSTDRGGRAPFFLSDKHQAEAPSIKHREATSVKRQATSLERQASSIKRQATSIKPKERQATSAEYGPSHRRPRTAFPGGRTADR